MKKLTVSKQAQAKLKKGLVLLEKQDFPQLDLINQAVRLQTPQGAFLGTAYLSEQNKGIGWLVSDQARELNQEFFRELFEEARAKRSFYSQSADTTAYRLFNQEGDGFGGFTADLYGDFVLFSWYNEFVYQIKSEIIAAFQQVYPQVLGGYEKIRFKGLDYESAQVYGQAAPETFEVLENGVRYQVFLNDGLMTGIFLDQHEVRASLVDGLAAGQSLLNLFSYTAAFSVAAAMGGASRTTSVDLAKRSRDLSQAHFRANGLDLAAHDFIVMDVFAYFKYAKRHGLTFDIIVIDPPSFARNKKQTFSVAKDYHRLVAEALEILEPQGTLILSTNAANLTKSKFKKEIEKGFAGRPHRYLAEYGLPADFLYHKKDETSNYLKVFTIKVDQ